MTPDADRLESDFAAGFAGVLTPAELTRLAEACERDDERLVQARTVFPPLTDCNATLPPEKVCAVCCALGLPTVQDTLQGFARLMMFADDRSAFRWAFVQAWDQLPRGVALPAAARACRRLLTGGMR